MTKPRYRHKVEDEHGRYGFEWGPARVIRLIGDEKYGYLLMIQTDHDELEVMISPKGRRITPVKA